MARTQLKQRAKRAQPQRNRNRTTTTKPRSTRKSRKLYSIEYDRREAMKLFKKYVREIQRQCEDPPSSFLIKGGESGVGHPRRSHLVEY